MSDPNNTSVTPQAVAAELLHLVEIEMSQASSNNPVAPVTAQVAAPAASAAVAPVAAAQAAVAPVLAAAPAASPAPASVPAATVADPVAEARQAITVALDSFGRNPSHIKAGATAGLIVSAIQTLIAQALAASASTAATSAAV